MVQDIATPLTRQLEIYRHQAVAAPTLLDDGPLAPSHVTQVLTQEGVTGRNRLFPPHLTLWTFLLQVLSPDGSCREALSRLRPWMIAKGSGYVLRSHRPYETRVPFTKSRDRIRE